MLIPATLWQCLRGDVVHNGGKVDLAVSEQEAVQLFLRVEDLFRLRLVHADVSVIMLLLFNVYRGVKRAEELRLWPEPRSCLSLMFVRDVVFNY